MFFAAQVCENQASFTFIFYLFTFILLLTYILKILNIQ